MRTSAIYSHGADATIRPNTKMILGSFAINNLALLQADEQPVLDKDE